MEFAAAADGRLALNDRECQVLLGVLDMRGVLFLSEIYKPSGG